MVVQAIAFLSLLRNANSYYLVHRRDVHYEPERPPVGRSLTTTDLPMRVISPRVVSGALSVSMSAAPWETARESLILPQRLRLHGCRGRVPGRAAWKRCRELMEAVRAPAAPQKVLLLTVQ